VVSLQFQNVGSEFAQPAQSGLSTVLEITNMAKNIAITAAIVLGTLFVAKMVLPESIKAQVRV